MHGVWRQSWLRSAGSPGVALAVFIVLLGVGGYVLTSTTIRHDRDGAAERRAEVEAVHAQEVLARARAYVAGLADVLAEQPRPPQAQFARLARAASAGVGLEDVLWVERVPASGRRRYERRRGITITRLTADGRLVPAPRAGSYLPAALTSGTRPELKPGVDATSFPPLPEAIGDQARIFAVGASPPGSLGTDAGFYLLQAAPLARGADSGYLVAFVPRGWFSTTLGGDPREIAISQDGRRIEGQLGSVRGTARFALLGRDWRIDVGRDPPSGLQSLLPWLALAWPFAAAAVALPVGYATRLRRRAQREVERIFDLSTDLMFVVGYDGRYKAVNPAFERTLGYPTDEIVGRPFSDFVLPDDLDASREAFAAVVGGDAVSRFDNRCVCADGSERWLEWGGRAVPEQKIVYGTARDVTERRRVGEELREATRTAATRGAELRARAGEQTALRHVATLVAREAPEADVFTAIAQEIGKLLGTDEIRMLRYEHDRSAVVVAAWGQLDEELFPVGARHPLGGNNATSRVFRTGRPARVEAYPATASGAIGDDARSGGLRCVVATPITVEGRLWGAMVTGTMRDETIPPETESRLAEFTELMATAIGNAEARAEVRRLAEEQTALRRVATLVAQDVPVAEIFSAASEEATRLLAAHAAVVRFEPDARTVVFAGVGRTLGGLALGTRWELDDPAESDSAGGLVAEAVRRLDVASVVTSPIVVGGRRWGAVLVASSDASMPPGVEQRLERFTELLATAIAKAEAREALGRLVDEQAALRRVATLAAEGAPPPAVFDGVAGEMQALLGADQVALNRFEPDDEMLVLAHRGLDVARTPVGSRVSTTGASATAAVRRTGRPARMEGYADAGGFLAELARTTGLRSSVSAPIVVEGRLWGVITASWKTDRPPPADTEERMTKFAGLLDTAIANADSRDQLTASRARLLTAADEARRRVVRDLHDGAQQRLVHTIVSLKLAQRALRSHDERAESFLGEALAQAEQSNAELRELAHGILPAVLSRGGLRSAVDAVISRLDLPVKSDVTAERFPAELEASAYFIVAEALTNVVKHARATRAEVRAAVRDGVLEIEVCDDGLGGADPDGHGLVGMGDRANALGGRLRVDSPRGHGTAVIATLPVSPG
jgi:PAS domain S-box-containing protein